MRPHFYCLPVLKREIHREALLAAATSGDARFFLGTDSAPHARGAKENDCGCAGCFTAATAMQMYATAFEAAGALDRLEAFASFHGADFYGLPRNRGTVTLERRPWTVPAELKFGDATVVPLGGGEPMAWQWVG
jgi:dihydroorotase